MKSILLAFAVLMLIFGLSVDVSAQRKRKKKRAPLPMPTPVQTVEPAVISRASDEVNLEDYNTNGQNAAVPAPVGVVGQEGVATDANPPVNGDAQAPPVSANLDSLTQQVRDLTSRLDSRDAQQRLLGDLQLLTTAEQRADTLRKQLADSTDKEGTIKVRLTELDYELRPEVIERKAAFEGSLRPEEVRESMRRKLQAEKDRLLSQQTQIQTGRATLEASIVSADQLVEKLRIRLETEITKQSAKPE